MKNGQWYFWLRFRAPAFSFRANKMIGSGCEKYVGSKHPWDMWLHHLRSRVCVWPCSVGGVDGLKSSIDNVGHGMEMPTLPRSRNIFCECEIFAMCIHIVNLSFRMHFFAFYHLILRPVLHVFSASPEFLRCVSMSRIYHLRIKKSLHITQRSDEKMPNFRFVHLRCRGWWSRQR